MLTKLWRLYESLMLMLTIMRIWLGLQLLCCYRSCIRMSVSLYMRSVRRRYWRDRTTVVTGAMLLILYVLW